MDSIDEVLPKSDFILFANYLAMYFRSVPLTSLMGLPHGC